jgi:hypothetical protein
MRVIGLFGAALIAASCGGGTITLPTGRPVPTTTAASVATPAATTSAEIDVCALMPLADVQADSPFSTPLATAEEGGAPTLCEYTSAPEADEPVGVLITVTDFGTASNAQVHQDNYRQQAVDSGSAVQDVSGVGDDAFAFGVDEVGVHASRGAIVVDVNLSGEYPATSDASKVSAATRLASKVFARLP